MKQLFWKLFPTFLLVSAALETGRSEAQDRLEFFAATLLITFCASGLLARHLARPRSILQHTLDTITANPQEALAHPLLGVQIGGGARPGLDADGLTPLLPADSHTQLHLMQEVSHELRSPLSRLQIAIGLAQQNPQNLHDSLDRIEYESLRMQTMLENMLTMAQLESGTPLQNETLDLYDIVVAVARDAELEAQARAQTVRVHGSDHHMVMGHADLLGRALDNIVRNAIKYSAPGTAIDIAMQADATHIHIHVSDRGPGVDAASLATIFEPFYRIPATQRSAQGYGLGLAITRRAVELHRGTISARNRAHGGLCVTIDLPRAEMSDRCQ